MSEFGEVGMNEIGCIFIPIHPDIQLHFSVLNLPSNRVHLRVSKLINLVDFNGRTQDTLLFEVSLSPQKIHIAVKDFVKFSPRLRQVVG